MALGLCYVWLFIAALVPQGQASRPMVGVHPIPEALASTANLKQPGSSSLAETESQTGLSEEVLSNKTGGPGSLFSIAARAAPLLSGQVSTSLETLRSHSYMVASQIVVIERQLDRLREQLKEDEALDKALESEIDKMKEGRKVVVSGLRENMEKASEEGENKLKDGFTTLESGTEDDSENNSLIELAKGDGDELTLDETQNVFKPLEEQSKEVERQYGQLQKQSMDVQTSILHEALTVKKLKEDLQMFTLMQTATQKQVDALNAGAQGGIVNMWKAMSAATAAGQKKLAGKLGGSSSEPDEVVTDKKPCTKPCDTKTTKLDTAGGTEQEASNSSVLQVQSQASQGA